jgi:[acyl-carrier-protein] S-malonyltransferase
MATAGRQFTETLSLFPVHRPTISFFTNTTGCSITEPEDIRESLAKQIVSPVNWEGCMRSVAQTGISEFYECGPKGVLAGLARRIERSWQVKKLENYSDLPSSYSVR